MFAEWIEAVKTFLSQHILLAIAIALFVEEIGVPLLIPGDVLMILAGIEVARGNASLAQVLLIESAVTLVGATILFYVSRGAGRSALLRFGPYVGLTHERVAAVESRLTRYQFRSVVLGRLTPGLRIIIVLVAGLANMEQRRFFPALVIGGFLYLLTYTLLGMLAGEAAIHFVDRFSIPGSAGASIVALGFLAIGLHGARQSRLLEQPLRPSILSAAAAGVFAATTALLASDVVRGLIIMAARLGGDPTTGSAVVSTSRLIGLLLNWPGFMVLALTLAMVVPWLGVRRRTRPVRLILTALLPFLLTLLFVNPALAGRGLGWSPGISLTAVAIVGVRWSVFALVLEYLDTVMYGERR